MIDSVHLLCFYGPESTGKSTLAAFLAEQYQTEYVPEVAREMITSNVFTEEDIINVGKAQTQRVREKAKTANGILFCDTDLITTQIYCQHYLHRVPDILYVLEREISYDAYFLFNIDVPWVGDGLRDLGSRRAEMYEVFKNELERRRIPYVNVEGNFDERERIIRTKIGELLS